MILVPWGNSIRNSMILDSSVPSSSSSAEPIYVCIVHSGRAAPTLHIHYLQTVLVLHQLYLYILTTNSASAAPIILTFIHPRMSGSAVPTSCW